MLQGTAEDTLLSRWYDSTAVYNIGLFKTVLDSADVNPEYALTLNESIAPDNHAEENEKAVNAIYLVTWAVDSFELTTEQYDILYAIANENPLTSGTGVYAARVMLGLHPTGASLQTCAILSFKQHQVNKSFQAAHMFRF